MPDKTYNKVVIDGTTYMDLSEDTVTADTILKGYTAHDRNGAAITGTAAFPVTSVNSKTGDVVLSTSDLTNDSGFITGMTILSYGHNTWADFLAAYTAQKVVYCRASSNSNPASGSQTRLAFMAYVNNAANPTEVEFQYYRSVSSHSATQQGDQVYVYKLNNKGTWSVMVREAYSKVVAGSGLSSSYAGGAITLSSNVTVPIYVSELINDVGYITEATPSYAIGSYYETTNFAFNPNSKFGGKWVNMYLRDIWPTDGYKPHIKWQKVDDTTAICAISWDYLSGATNIIQFLPIATSESIQMTWEELISKYDGFGSQIMYNDENIVTYMVPEIYCLDEIQQTGGTFYLFVDPNSHQPVYSSDYIESYDQGRIYYAVDPNHI